MKTVLTNNSSGGLTSMGIITKNQVTQVYNGYNNIHECTDLNGNTLVAIGYVTDLLGLICGIKTGENGKSLNKVLADRIYDIGQFSQEGGHLNETRMRLFMLVQYLNAIKVELDVKDGKPSAETILSKKMDIY